MIKKINPLPVAEWCPPWAIMRNGLVDKSCTVIYFHVNGDLLTSPNDMPPRDHNFQFQLEPVPTVTSSFPSLITALQCFMRVL